MKTKLLFFLLLTFTLGCSPKPALVVEDNSIRQKNSINISYPSAHYNEVLDYRMDTVFSDISHINEGYKTNLDGIIGYELLSRQLSVLSYKRKELRLY